MREEIHGNEQMFSRSGEIRFHNLKYRRYASNVLYHLNANQPLDDEEMEIR